MYHFSSRIVFLIGILLGSLFAVLYIKFNKMEKPLLEFKPIPENPQYDKWFKSHKIERVNISLDHFRYGTHNFSSESDFLYKQVQVLCVVLVKKKKNFNAAKATWGKSCNELKSLQLDVSKKVPGKRKKENSNWVLLCDFIRKFSGMYQWILFVYDTTFVILENLRLLLAPLNYTKGYYLGHAINLWTIAYNSGKAGYVISHGALLKLKERLGRNEGCSAKTAFLNQEDFYLGKHLSTLSIFPGDTRDSVGLSRFHIYNWQHEFFPGLNYYKTSVYPAVCCSIYTVTFKAIEADKMYQFYYLLYQLQIFKGGTLGNMKQKPMPKDLVWKKFLSENGFKETVTDEEYYNLWKGLMHDMYNLNGQYKEKYDF